MIVITSDLPELSFVNKPMVVAFQCLGNDGVAFAPLGERREIVFQSDLFIGIGEHIVFNFQDLTGIANSSFFIFKSQLENDSDLPIPSVDFRYWLNTVIQKAQNDFNFAYHFKSSYRFIEEYYDVNNNVLVQKAAWVIEAKENVLNYTISPSVGLPVVISDTIAAKPDTTPPNYKLCYEVFGHSGQKIFSGFSLPNTEGVIRFDVSRILRNFIFSKLIIPPNSNYLQLHVAPSKYPYHIRYQEQFGVPAQIGSWSFFKKQVIRGDAAGNPYAKVLPLVKHIGINDPEYLAFHNPTTLNLLFGIEVRTTARATGLVTLEYFGGDNILLYDYEQDSYEYGSYSTQNVPAFGPVLRENETMMIPVLNYHTSTDVAMLEIRILYDINKQPAGDWVTYMIDPYYYPEVRFLAFLNRFGVWENFRFTGNTGIQSDVKRRSVQSYRDDYVRLETASVQPTRRFVYRTGWLSREESLALESLCQSQFVCEIIPGVGYIPLQLTDTKYAPDDGKKQSFSIEIAATPLKQVFNTLEEIIERW